MQFDCGGSSADIAEARIAGSDAVDTSLSSTLRSFLAVAVIMSIFDDKYAHKFYLNEA